ncbi:MAG: 2-oxoacid:acceptor oxidoreductase subunit alpha [Gammaproteobacteria bacterium]|nr:2-oxoacid:acceptor oxidoreductase subunit alpha [Gammaproteobacteria bacterium]NNF62400.1 2-oxoacid:acceptor oxidoreductase subunit alpha [Gammaproteobacteria bacterium]NNM20910.1 2-oxoacid:acceptor oxidoreductase subunit alpha [Gammaproteobacteria bacterium]
MLGDHACAEGALAAGLDFFAGYPITPSTEVAEHLARRLPDVGGRFVQMEDELGSIAAIIGASAAGARSFTATSGPGFSLMMENIGLAAMMELPCVIVDVQRASPSTGLPTMVGQSDILQARWGSHGDYGIVAYCPASPQECFELTIAAFNTADRYRIPVLILMDEVIGHMAERVIIPEEQEIDRTERKGPLEPPGAKPFLPYAAEEDLVPRIAHAGDGHKVHMTGLTHDERGYPALTAATHDKLVRRLVDKVRLNAGSIVEFEEIGLDDAETVVIAYGCTARSARRAVREARNDGQKVGLLRPKTIWPFPQTRLQQLLEAGTVTRIVVPEVNLGQLRREVERHTRLPVIGLNHAGGEMPTPAAILEVITS